VVSQVPKAGPGAPGTRRPASNDATKKTLHGIVTERILPNSVVYTDEYTGYNGLENVNGYQHRRINHDGHLRRHW
jgi:transposase-like protein